METQSDKLLHDLVEHEKVLVSKVEQAKVDAEEIVARARREAAAIVAEAEAEAERHNQEVMARSRAEAETLQGSALEAIHAEVAAAKARMEAGLGAAVEHVLERVVP